MRVGARFDDLLQIVEGLEAGETVVSGELPLSDNARRFIQESRQTIANIIHKPTNGTLSKLIKHSSIKRLAYCDLDLI